MAIFSVDNVGKQFLVAILQRNAPRETHSVAKLCFETSETCLVVAIWGFCSRVIFHFVAEIGNSTTTNLDEVTGRLEISIYPQTAEKHHKSNCIEKLISWRRSGTPPQDIQVVHIPGQKRHINEFK